MSTRRQRERRLVTTLGVALLALVAGIALVVRGDLRGRSTAVPEDGAGAVSRIEIVRTGRADIVLEREAGDDWRVVAPCALDANDARIEPLLGALAARALDYPAGEVDLEAAGLLEPLAEVRIDGTAIHLGGTDLGGERRYALRGDRVALVPEWALSLVDGGLSALAELVPFPEAPTALRRIGESDGGGGGERGGDGPEVADGADDVAGPGVALDPVPWAGLAASQIVPWPVPDAPQTTRTAGLEATLASGEGRRLALVGNASWNALRIEGEACAWLFADDALPPDSYP